MYIREGMGGTTARFSSIPVITRSPVLRARKWDLCQALTCTSMHRTRPPRRSAKKIYSCQRATRGVGGVAVSGVVVGYGTARTTQPTLPGPFLPRGAGALENGGGSLIPHFSLGGTFRTEEAAVGIPPLELHCMFSGASFSRFNKRLAHYLSVPSVAVNLRKLFGGNMIRDAKYKRIKPLYLAACA